MISFKEFCIQENEEVYLFDVETFKEVIRIANKHALRFGVDEKEFEIEFAEDNDDEAMDAFYADLEEAGIEFMDDEEEDAVDVDEQVRLKRTSASDRRENKKRYRQNKAKIKIAQRKFRKSAKGKRLAKRMKRFAKRGKTSTGKRITRRT